MRSWFSVSAIAVVLCHPHAARAQDVTVIAPGGMRCPLEKMTPEFGRATGLTLKATIGAGGATHRQVVRGELFDVSIVQPPYQDVLDSGNVAAASETPLAAVAVVAVIRQGDPVPDISSPDGVRRMLLAARAISYPDPNGGLGGAAGVSFDATQKTLGIFDAVQRKVKRVQGVALLDLMTRADIDVAVTFASEIAAPGVRVLGALPAEISTPTALVGFVSSRTKQPAAAQALLAYLSSPSAAVAYRACAMQPGR